MRRVFSGLALLPWLSAGCFLGENPNFAPDRIADTEGAASSSSSVTTDGPVTTTTTTSNGATSTTGEDDSLSDGTADPPDSGAGSTSADPTTGGPLDSPPLPHNCVLEKFDTFDDGELSDWGGWGDDGASTSEVDGALTYTIEAGTGPATAGIQLHGWNMVGGVLEIHVIEGPRADIAGNFLWMRLSGVDDCAVMPVADGTGVGFDGQSTPFFDGWLRLEGSDTGWTLSTWNDGAWKPQLVDVPSVCDMSETSVMIFSGVTAGPVAEQIDVRLGEVRVCSRG